MVFLKNIGKTGNIFFGKNHNNFCEFLDNSPKVFKTCQETSIQCFFTNIIHEKIFL